MLMHEKICVIPIFLSFDNGLKQSSVRLGILEIYAKLFNFQTHNGAMTNDVKASYWIRVKNTILLMFT